MHFKALLVIISLTIVYPFSADASSCRELFGSAAKFQDIALTDVRQSDFADLKRIFQDPANVKMSGDRVADETIAWLLKESTTNSTLRPNWEMFISGIRDTKSGRVIGVFQLYDRTPDGSATLGFTVDKEFWGKGLTTEMGRSFARYAFEKLGIHRIDAATLQSNIGANRVLQKMGFAKVGEKEFEPGLMDNVYVLQGN